MPEVHQAPAGGKGGAPPGAHRALLRLVEAAYALRDAWNADLEGPTYPRSLPSFAGLTRELAAWLADLEARPAAPTVEVRPLDLTDPAATRAWLADLRTQIDDAVAAGEDATRPPGRRLLGRPMARSAIVEARHALDQLLAAAERGTLAPEG